MNSACRRDMPRGGLRTTGDRRRDGDRRCPAFLAATLLLATSLVGVALREAGADEWLGFRGLGREAVAASDAIPVRWSAGENVAWKTPMPGRGYSSPVVTGERVYVTTAYEATEAKTVRAIVDWFEAGLACLLGVGVSLWVTQSLGGRLSRRVGLGAVLWTYAVGLVAAVVIGLVLFGQDALGLVGRAANRWLGATLVALGALAVAGAIAPAFSPWRLAAALAAALLPIPAYLVVEQKDLLFRPESGMGMLMLGVLALPLCLAVGLGVTHLRACRRGEPGGGGASGDGGTRPVALPAVGVLLAVLATAVAVALGFRELAGRSVALTRFVGTVRLQPMVGWAGLAVVAVAGIGLALAGVRYLSRLPLSRHGVLLALGCVVALLVAVVILVDWNVLLGSRRNVYAVVALNRADGRIEWISECLTAFRERIPETNSPATPTPALADGRVYAYFGTPGLVCVDSQGGVVWMDKSVPFHGRYGPATSPVVCEGIVVQATDSEPGGHTAGEDLPLLTAFDARTGEVLWRRMRETADGKPGAASYTTPIVQPYEGRNLLLLRRRADLRCYDLRTGERLATYPIAYSGVGLVASPASDDRRVYLAEPRRTCALTLEKVLRGEEAEAWSREVPGPTCSSPAVAGGRLFLVSDTGLATCLDAETGKPRWKKRLRGTYYPSVIASGERVYFGGNDGRTTVMANADEPHVLAENDLHEETRATMTPVDGQCFIRTEPHLYCIEEAGPPSP